MSDPVNARFPSSDGITYTVHKQPIALDRFTIHDIRPHEATGEWKYLYYRLYYYKYL